MTVQDCLNAAAGLLIHAGFTRDEARADIAALSRHLLGWTTAEWATRLRDEAPADFGARLAVLARRRATREPVAYITGVREFYGRPFRVTPAVLIPRPETEGAVDAALTAAKGRTAPLIVDVGTGSGCIAVTLALELPNAHVAATDVSREALDVAAANAEALGARDVRFVEVRPTQFLPPDLRPDIIVSNPPYVSSADRESLQADVRDFEPALALFAGDDGLGVITGLARVARRSLATGGELILEIGAGQAGAVQRLLESSGFHVDAILPDLQGIPRVVRAH